MSPAESTAVTVYVPGRVEVGVVSEVLNLPVLSTVAVMARVLVLPDVFLVVRDTLAVELATKPLPDTFTVPPGGTTPVAEMVGWYATVNGAAPVLLLESPFATIWTEPALVPIGIAMETGLRTPVLPATVVLFTVSVFPL
jgi:hypothetical protein